MNNLENVIAYFCLHYPHKRELSKARLTKLVYLADWFSALIFRRQITNINWIFNHYGPYVDDIARTVSYNNNFRVINTFTQFNTEKSIIYYIGRKDNITISNDEVSILNFVIEKTKNFYFDEFIDYVYSTYPISSNERYSELNLVQLAEQFRNINNL